MQGKTRHSRRVHHPSADCAVTRKTPSRRRSPLPRTAGRTEIRRSPASSSGASSGAGDGVGGGESGQEASTLLNI